MIGKIAICLLLGYAFGCFSTGYFVGKLHHIDIRQYGSGNAGTTNALRTLGKKAGAMTFLGDVLKCIIPILFIRHILFVGVEYLPLLVLYTAVGVVLGHNYPFYLHFKGGKGIAAMAYGVAAGSSALPLLDPAYHHSPCCIFQGQGERGGARLRIHFRYTRRCARHLSCGQQLLLISRPFV